MTLQNIQIHQSQNNLFQSALWENFHSPNSIRINEKLFIKHPLPFGLYWLECPMSEVTEKEIAALVSSDSSRIASNICAVLAIFLRFNVSIERNQPYIPAKNSRKTKNSHFPQATIIIDLTQTEEEILAQMKQKGRYNIKIAQKNNVSVHEYNTSVPTPAGRSPIEQKISHKDPSPQSEGLNTFYELLKKTASRDRFHIHPKSHYEKMLKILGPNNAKLFLAKFNNQTVAAAIVTFYGDTATYYYGASDHDLRHLMAPYLLHFEIMRSAAAHGYKKYDLFGIAPTYANEAGTNLNQKIHQTHDKNHPWSGVTEFKKKFGGKYIEYHEPREIILRPVWYWLYRFAKFFYKE